MSDSGAPTDRRAVTYAELTRQDPNPIKRWLQERRLADALALVPEGVGTVVDFGGGDGELAARVARAHPAAAVICFEPVAVLRQEAVHRLVSLTNASVAAEEGDVADGIADVVLCTEVLEHLPAAATSLALDHVERMLRPGGALIAGVPVEIGPAALVKGVFRMGRRYGAFDALPAHVLAATLGRPPRDRPERDLAPGRPYIGPHMGFDHRTLRRELLHRFDPSTERTSPLPGLPAACASELYILVFKRG